MSALWLRTRDDPAKPPATFVEREGKLYRLIRLPDAAPPANRSPRTRFHFRDVEKPGTADVPMVRKRRRAS